MASSKRRFILKNKDLSKDQKMRHIIQTEKDLDTILVGESFQVNLDHKLDDFVITTKNEDTGNFVQNCGLFVEFSEQIVLSSSILKHEYVIKGIPLDFPLHYIEDRLSERGTVKAFRLKYFNKSSNTLNDSRTVKIACDFLIKEEKLTLGMLGLRDVSKFSKPILRCYKCQQFGHVQNKCKNNQKCGICAESHSTEICINKKSQNLPVNTKCAGCGLKHEARYVNCSKRVEYAHKISNKSTDRLSSNKKVNIENMNKNKDTHFPPLTSKMPQNINPAKVKSDKILAIKKEMSFLRGRLDSLEKLLDDVLVTEDKLLDEVIDTEENRSLEQNIFTNTPIKTNDQNPKSDTHIEHSTPSSPSSPTVEKVAVDENVTEHVENFNSNNIDTINDEGDDDDDDIFVTPSENLCNEQTDLNESKNSLDDSGVIDASNMQKKNPEL